MNRTARTAQITVAAIVVVPAGLLLASVPVAAEPTPGSCLAAANLRSDAAVSRAEQACALEGLTPAQIVHRELAQLQQRSGGAPATPTVTETSNESSGPSSVVWVVAGLSALAVAGAAGVAIARRHPVTVRTA
jgi:hypothetical protein